MKREEVKGLHFRSHIGRKQYLYFDNIESANDFIKSINLKPASIFKTWNDHIAAGFNCNVISE